ncbi:MAG: cyclase family protein [Acidobacteriota bacterium]
MQIEEAGKLDSDGFWDQKLTFGKHVGTHIDAPAHMLESGKQLKDFPAERFIREAVCIDASDGFDAAVIQNADIKSGMAVVFYTGASDYFTEEKYWHEYHVLDEESYQSLKDMRVSMIGLDTGSADIDENFPVHKSLLGSDILIIENLTNLKELVGQKFELVALPLKLEKDGVPARVVARK